MNASSFDAIVIGSGAGGTAAAYRLALGGLRVALLEKGAHLPKDGSTLDIRRVVHGGEFLSRETWLDGRGNRLMPEEHFNVGGKTKWYGAALLRFAEHEFRADVPHGCAAWPVTLAEMAPYYHEAERLLGVRQFDYEPDLARLVQRLARTGSSWRAQPMPMGLASDIALNRPEAAHFDGFASVGGMKAEAEHSILRLLHQHPRFTLTANAEVTQLIGAPGMPREVRGVRTADGREFYAPRIFLAAGALHSPRLLDRYLKTSALAHELEATWHVGRHLKLHLLTALVALSPSAKTDLIRKTALLTHERYPHSSVQPLGFDGELIGTLVPKILPVWARTLVGTRSYGFFLQTEDASHPDNRVYDDAEAGLPVMDYDEARSAAGSREHRDLTRAFQRALAACGFMSFTRRVGLNGTAHACGTLRAGHDPSDSVVDSEGRVHGLQGLYVVDGSVLPRSSSVNPSLSIYAWGLRVGDRVAQQFLKEKNWPLREVAHAS